MRNLEEHFEPEKIIELMPIYWARYWKRLKI